MATRSPLKKGTFFFSGHMIAVFLKPEKMDVPFFNGLPGGAHLRRLSTAASAELRQRACATARTFPLGRGPTLPMPATL
jgi:hypothetical protein